MSVIKYVCTSLSYFTFLSAAWADGVTIVNNLPSSSPCSGGNTVSVFLPNQKQQVIAPAGGQLKIQGDFSASPGIGLQVNNWYWTSVKMPVQSNPQNPDNSGAQFTISKDCNLTSAPPWYGNGIPTYLIANVSASKSNGGCTIAIGANSYTNAVTPSCCAPPGIGANTCTMPWGKKTDNGKPWPPS